MIANNNNLSVVNTFKILKFTVNFTHKMNFIYINEYFVLNINKFYVLLIK